MKRIESLLKITGMKFKLKLGNPFSQTSSFVPDRRKSLGLGTRSFVKVPRPGDSEVTFSVFKSSCHLLLPV